MLAAWNGDLSAKSEMGRTALHYASAQGRPECVRLLIDSGADVRAADNYGDTALHRAAMYGHLDVARLLLDSGATPHAANAENMSPVDVAWEMGWPEMVELLRGGPE